LQVVCQAEPQEECIGPYTNMDGS